MRLFAVLFAAVLTTTTMVQAQNMVCPIDLVFLLDRSGSICDTDPSFIANSWHTCDNWENMKQFVINFIQGIDIGRGNDQAQVSLLTFDSSVNVQWRLDRTTNKFHLIQMVRDLQYVREQHTHMADALDAAENIFGGPDDRDIYRATNAAILVTDGWPYDDSQLNRVIPSAINLKNSGVKLFSVGVQTKDLNETILRQMSSYPQRLNQNYFISTTFNQLPVIGTIRSELQRNVCPETTTTTTTTTTTPRTTTTPFKEECEIDLLFLVDRSGSICDEDPNFNRHTDITCDNFESEKKFIADYVRGIDIGYNAARVALVTFDTHARINWGLTKYTNKDQLIQRILNIDYEMEKHTHMADAFDLVKKVFTKWNGEDRPDAENFVVIITDGFPYDALQLARLDRSVEEAQAIAKVYAVGVTHKKDTKRLAEISSPPHRLNFNYFTSPDFRQLDNVLKPLTGETCHNKTVIIECPVDLVLLLDVSGSICNDLDVRTCSNWVNAIEFLARLVEGMEVGGATTAARIALVTFGSRAELKWNLLQYQRADQLKREIQRLQYEPMQNTYTGDGLEIMLQRVFGSAGDRDLAANVAVILTDGLPSSEQKTKTIQLAEDAHRRNIKIFMVGVGVQKDIDTDMLRRLSSPNHEHGTNYFTSPDYAHVNTLVKQVREGTCKEDIVLPPNTDCDMELAFLVDVSSAVCGNQALYNNNCYNWEQLKSFMMAIINSLRIGPQDTRVAMITFGDRARIRWNLDRYDHKDSLLDAVARLSYSPFEGSTPADALMLARNNVFHTFNVRRNSNHVIVFIGVEAPSSSKQRESCAPEAMRCDLAGISVIPVGVTGGYHPYHLGIMSGGSRDEGVNFFQASDFSRLQSLVPALLQSPAMSTFRCENNFY